MIVTGLAVGGYLVYRARSYHKPPDEAKRFYDKGIAALREGTYLQATKALQHAVEVDKGFAVAHARLAEAWAELDFTGEAQSEMLIATAADQRGTMPDLDRKYVDAVHATLIRDYSAAAQDYEEILNKLPDDQRADGYVDLGKAYEKAGKIKETMASYEQAAKLRPDDPAPFVHLGIWKSRQRDPVGAEVAFQKAEELYEADSNLEGQAEVAYQRGYAANEAADSAHAHEYLDKSLTIARQIENPQLEARTLSQLSSVEYNDSKDDEAIADANHAIQIARDHNLEYWLADGLMRLGNAYLDKLDFSNAESYSQQALGLAQQNHHPRLEAASQLTLASVRDEEGTKRNEQIALAEDALNYYRDFGFMNLAAEASTLVVRAKESEGEFADAFRSGTELLDIAAKTNSQASIERAEETVGDAALDLEEYPSALVHFQRALAVGRKLHQNEAYQALHCAEILWRLGRYLDADEMLASIPAEWTAHEEIRSGMANARARMELSKGQYQEAMADSRKALRGFRSLSPARYADFVEVEALAEGYLNDLKHARRDADSLLDLAHRQNDEDALAQAQMLEADISLRLNRPDDATAFAQSANAYYSAKNLKESTWLSLLYLAKAAHERGDAVTSREKASRALGILGGVARSWGFQIFGTYISRPDYASAAQELSALQNREGVHHEQGI